MRRYKSAIWIFVTLLSVTWPFAAVWLHAHQLIGHSTESRTSWLCLLGAVFGPACYWNQSKSQNVLHILSTIVVVFMAMAVVVTARRYSDRMFTYWIMRAVPKTAWQQMASDIDSLAKQAAAQNKSIIPAKDLPKSFHYLGLADKSWGGNAIMDFGDGQVGVRVAYGNKNRRWGLLVGPEEFLNRWSKYRCIPVTTNAQFFIGDEW